MLFYCFIDVCEHLREARDLQHARCGKKSATFGSSKHSVALLSDYVSCTQLLLALWLAEWL
jgi:hypothetical protein